jgi:hypothetical protein
LRDTRCYFRYHPGIHCCKNEPGESDQDHLMQRTAHVRCQP